MARKRNKGAQVQTADPCSALQTQKPQPAQSRAQKQPNPRPKPELKQKPEKKPAVVITSTNKTEQPYRKKPKASGNSSSKQPGPAPKTAFKIVKVSLEPLQTKTGQKMARNGNNKSAPAQKAPAAKLDLPEGYTAPKTKNHGPRKRPKKEDKVTPREPDAVMPWVLNDKYPQPLGNLCGFRYERIWRSLIGKDVAAEMNKAFSQALMVQLRNPKLTKEQQKELHDQLWSEGKHELHKAVLAGTDGPVSNKIFPTLSLVDVSQLKVKPAEELPGLLGIMQVGELGKMITDKLCPSVGDITALASTCKRAAVCLEKSFERWDFNSGAFSAVEFSDKRDASGRLVQGGGKRTSILVISPISGESPEKPYTADFQNLVRLCGAISEIPKSFRTIVLDQIPYLNVDLFEIMVNSMPNLEAVAITRCQMLDVTKLKPLLDVIRRHPRPSSSKRGQTGSAGDAKYISLDFGPFFFHGPNSADRLGSYGVTYNEPTFHTPKAVFALVLRCWSLAKEVGMDLMSESSSFWNFVRRLPGPDVLWAMKAREALLTWDHDITAHKRCVTTIRENFSDDLMAALSGDNQPHPVMPHSMKKRLPEKEHLLGPFWREQRKCPMCHFTYSKGLFPLRPDTCWSCKMDQYVAYNEDSHLRLWQESVMGYLLHDIDPRHAKIQQLLSDARHDTIYMALEEARLTDSVRDFFLAFRSSVTRRTLQPAPATSSEPEWSLPGVDMASMVIEDGPQSFCPPPPKTLDGTRASMTRWRWFHQEARAAFDYREGGPQRESPCKKPVSYAYTDFGPEDDENFDKRWEWTRHSLAVVNEQFLPEFERRVREEGLRPDQARKEWAACIRDYQTLPDLQKMVKELERTALKKLDRQVHVSHHAHVQDCLVSMGTPGDKPFNLDKPTPDPGVNAEEYNAVIAEHLWESSPYNFTKNGFW